MSENKQDAVLLGPCVGEFYWETARFAPLLPAFRAKKYKGRDIKYIVLTRAERFDLYGLNADILVPLNIEGDYAEKKPDCFRLTHYDINDYTKLAEKFYTKYSKQYRVIHHLYPNIDNKHFKDKNQFSLKQMLFEFKPRKINYELVEQFLPDNGKPNVILAPRYRNGFKRNWKNWKDFYDKLYQDKKLLDKFNFIICGKPGEYIPDEKHRFLDMNNINMEGYNASLVGLLLVLLEKSIFVFGSQSAIPNLGLLYKKEVLEFGCQKHLHSISYNIFNSPITFIENKKYDISVDQIYSKFKELLKKY